MIKIVVAASSLSTLVALVAGPAAAEPVAATVDATRTGPPITPLVFGGFMEPATNRVWAEMLADRKFFNRVTSQPDPAAVTGGFGRRGPQPRWLPVGPDEVVEMDRASAFVGEWSPRVRLEAAVPHGIGQAGLVLRAGLDWTADEAQSPYLIRDTQETKTTWHPIGA